MRMESILPLGWCCTSLEKVATWGSGGTPSRNIERYFQGTIPWVKTGELESKYIRETEEHISEEALNNSSAKIFPKGSVGIAMYGATIGKLSIWGIDASTNQACAVGIPTEAINNEFLYYYLLSERQNLIKAGKGGAQPNLSQGIIKEWPINLPPHPEQHRIVAKIEELFSELDKGIENLKTAQAQLKVYRQALLKHAFEGKLTAQWRAENKDKLETAEALLKRIQQERAQRYQQQLADWQTNGGSKPKAPKSLPPLTAKELAELPELPEGWGWTRLGNTNVEVSDGPFGSNLKSSDYVDSGVRVVRLENIGALKFIEEKESFVTEEKYELLKRHTVTSGDIVFSSFILENVRVALVPPSITKAINKADCFCVRFSGETLSNVYAVLFLSTRHVYKQLESLIHGVGRPRINTTQLKDVVVPVCGAAEQQVIISEIESRLSEVDQLDQTITTSLQQAEALRQSILKKAYAGQLVPQDPHEEPASALLARIKAEKMQPTEKSLSRSKRNE
jgi:type I restriction enzyme, S subunit